MFPHEEFLQKALEECMITQLVRDLGNLYFSLYVRMRNNKEISVEEFTTVISVNRILDEAADKIAELGPKPKIPHPMD